MAAAWLAMLLVPRQANEGSHDASHGFIELGPSKPEALNCPKLALNPKLPETLNPYFCFHRFKGRGFRVSRFSV